MRQVNAGRFDTVDIVARHYDAGATATIGKSILTRFRQSERPSGHQPGRKGNVAVSARVVESRDGTLGT
jgi:hypothetical protein